MIKQLYKLIDVLAACSDVTEDRTVDRDLALIKVHATPPTAGRRSSSWWTSSGARSWTWRTSSLIVEVTGDEEKVRQLLRLLRPFGIKEMVRTGHRRHDPRRAHAWPRLRRRKRLEAGRESASSAGLLGPCMGSRDGRTTMARIYYDDDADLGRLRGQEGRHPRLRQPGARPRPEPARQRASTWWSGCTRAAVAGPRPRPRG